MLQALSKVEDREDLLGVMDVVSPFAPEKLRDT